MDDEFDIDVDLVKLVVELLESVEASLEEGEGLSDSFAADTIQFLEAIEHND